MDILNNLDKFCGVPFSDATIHLYNFSTSDLSKISLVPCCSAWLNPPFSSATLMPIPENNTSTDILHQWNSPFMIEFRKSILNLSYKYCKTSTCPYFSSNKLPKIPQLAIPHILNNSLSLPYPPITLKLCIDPSCNLQCPSCRSYKINISNHITYSRTKLLMNSGAKFIFLNGSGELFYNIHMLNALREYSPSSFPNIQGFLIISNGTLLNKTTWLSLPESLRQKIIDLNISVDALSKNEYESIRLNANFNSIYKNLLFISSLRKSNELKHTSITCILQKKNVHLLYHFVSSAISLNFDTIIINKIENWFYPNDYFYNHLALPPNWQSSYKKIISDTLNLINNSNSELISNVLWNL